MNVIVSIKKFNQLKEKSFKETLTENESIEIENLKTILSELKSNCKICKNFKYSGIRKIESKEKLISIPEPFCKIKHFSVFNLEPVFCNSFKISNKII